LLIQEANRLGIDSSISQCVPYLEKVDQDVSQALNSDDPLLDFGVGFPLVLLELDFVVEALFHLLEFGH
jgi:hypothetical protein